MGQSMSYKQQFDCFDICSKIRNRFGLRVTKTTKYLEKERERERQRQRTQNMEEKRILGERELELNKLIAECCT